MLTVQQFILNNLESLGWDPMQDEDLWFTHTVYYGESDMVRYTIMLYVSDKHIEWNYDHGDHSHSKGGIGLFECITDISPEFFYL